ncbi:hypothetical protein CEXT_437611 [Caerostris extrusa]|uniref:Uncharacterized protein n=1 Tax=Caerostris extrusa TaxID=172846 RepID=A0AAV4U900_CAEEX|nr:hypothetical protein CEXT_437611 [Caerostris extrusa]
MSPLFRKWEFDIKHPRRDRRTVETCLTTSLSRIGSVSARNGETKIEMGVDTTRQWGSDSDLKMQIGRDGGSCS